LREGRPEGILESGRSILVEGLDKKRKGRRINSKGRGEFLDGERNVHGQHSSCPPLLGFSSLRRRSVRESRSGGLKEKTGKKRLSWFS